MPATLKIVILALVFAAGAYDLRFRRIPNWLNASGVVLGFGLNLLLSGWHGFAAALLGFLLAVAIYFPLYLVRGMGAGDVKLMAAVGSLAGPGAWLGIFLATALAGGVVSLLLIFWKRRAHRTFLNLAVIGVELLHFRAPAAADQRLDIRNSESLRLPHGAVIACGTAAYLLFTAARAS